MTRPRLSRRAFLAATGSSALLLPLLNHEHTLAEEPVFPKRILFLVTGNGTIEDAFWPSGADGKLTLPEITSPLEAHKSQLLFPRGIDMKVWAEDNPFGGNGDAHHNFGAILTATILATGDPPHDPGGPGLALASSISIDQHIARAFDAAAVAQGKEALRFPVLSARTWGRDGTGYATLSWTGDRAPFSAESNPARLFDTLFAGGMPGNTPDRAALEQQRTRRSVLDYVGGALERQGKRLGSDDYRKIQIHLEAVRNIERQLQSSALASSCQPPVVPSIDVGAIASFPAIVDAEMDLISAAFACGLTRVATLALGDGEDYNIYFPWLGIDGKGIEFPTRHKHDIAHRPGENNADKIKTEQWFASAFARLLDKLSSVPEGSGTMLDNTVVLWLNSLNSGFSHTVLKLPVIVAGGANTGIRTGGRLLELGSQAHNKLLASLANAVGVPMDGWGDPRFHGTLDLS